MENNHINGSKLKQIAVLFDVENISPENIFPVLFKKLTELGFNSFPRKIIFNNVTQLKKAYLGKAIKEYHLSLICTYSSTGKNIADFRLYIEALDLLYNNPELDGFCIVSGDADYSELVIRLMHANKYIIGVGPQSKCKPEYVNLFSDFYFIEDLLMPEEKTPVIEEPKPATAINQVEKDKTVVKKAKKDKSKAKKTMVSNEIKKAEKNKAVKKSNELTEEKIKRSEKDKNDSFYVELTSGINSIIENYKNNNQDKLYFSNLVKELKDNSYYLESFNRITLKDIEKCNFKFTTNAEGKKESSYILIKEPINN